MMDVSFRPKRAACLVCGLLLLVIGCVLGHDPLNIMGCTFIIAGVFFC